MSHALRRERSSTLQMRPRRALRPGLDRLCPSPDGKLGPMKFLAIARLGACVAAMALGWVLLVLIFSLG